MKLDAQLEFYLKHQRHIDEWVGLRDRVPAEAHRFLSDLGPAVQQMAATLGDDVAAHVDCDSDHPKLFLYRKSWREPGDKLPRVAVGLEWVRKTAHFARAYSGVWVDRGATGGPQLEKVLQDGLADVARTIEAKRRNWWPVLRTEVPSEADWWEKLPAWREQLLARLRGQWDHLAGPVDELLTAYDATNQAEAEFVSALAQSFEQLAGALGPDVLVHKRLGTDWPGLRLYRPSWDGIGAKIGIEWQPGDCSTASMYFGVSLNAEAHGFKPAYSVVRDRAPSLYREPPWSCTRGWPIARQLNPAREPAQRRDEIISLVTTLWHDLDEAVSSAVRAPTAGT